MPNNRLFVQYQGQTSSQGVYLEIDTRDEVAKPRLDYNAEIGGAVPSTVYHGLVIRVHLDYIPTDATADEIEADEEVQALAQRIIDGTETTWDGNNHVGRANEDAEIAAEALVMDVLPRWTDEYGTWEQSNEVWPAEASQAFDADDRAHPAELADKTDAEINALANTLISELPAHVEITDDLAAWLRYRRDEGSDV